jgi:uncharacterized repeat protein (TIGR01451 family)
MKSTVLPACLALLLAAAGFAQIVVVDGDLSDIRLVAHGQQADPFNEICLLSKSGFDLRWVHVFYDESEDTLYFGLDLMDVPDPDFPGAIGRSGPGVPGDADGDEDPDTATEPSCPVQEEQNDIGPDEIYLIKIDTNANGLFGEFEDVRVVYRDNTLRFEHGDSSPYPGPTGDIVVGTAGAPVDPMLPNQNRNTEDIEIAVHHWSTLDPVPECFIVSTFSGSLVDGFPEDELITPIPVEISEPSVLLEKDVRNVSAGGGFASNASVEIGDVVEFRLLLSNTGNVPLQPVGIVDTLPSELEFIPESVAGATVFKTIPVAGGLEITLRDLEGQPVLPDGVTRTVTFQATVLPTFSGAAVNRATGGGIPPGECGDDAVTDEDTASVSLVDLACTKEVSLDGSTWSDTLSAALGQTVSFRVTLDNPSAVDLEEAEMVDTLPSGYENIVPLSPGCTVVGQTITCAVGTLPAETSVTIEYEATVASTASGVLVNTALCTAVFEETIPLETSCSAEVTVLVPDLACDKQVSLDGVDFFDSLDVIPGFDVFFRVAVTNTGDAPLSEVTIEDTLPEGFDGVAVVSGPCGASGRTVRCSGIPTLDPGQQATVVYRATVTATNPPVTALTNTAHCRGTAGIPGNPGETVSTQCDATVHLLSPCITCVKEVSLDGVDYFPSVEALPEQHVWFRVRVTNCGTTPLTDVVLTDDVPDLLVNVTTGEADCGIAGNTVTCSIPALATGVEWVVTFEADIDSVSGGMILNTASLTATPAVQGIPGDDIGTQCSAQLNVGPLEIPTLSDWGLILLCSLLVLTLILHQRYRHCRALVQD